MSEALLYHNIPDLEYRDAEYLSHIVEVLLRTVSVAGVLKDVGEPYEDLIPLIKYLVSELVLELHIKTYVNGVAEELSNAVKLRLWDVGDELRLAELIGDLAELGTRVNEGVVDRALAEKVLREFVGMFSVDVGSCSLLKEVLKRCDPHTVLQTVLVGLIVSVGGVGYSQE